MSHFQRFMMLALIGIVLITFGKLFVFAGPIDPVAGNNNINPIRTIFSITPSDSSDLQGIVRYVKVGATGGIIRAIPADGTATVDIPVAAYDTLSGVMLKRIYSTGTTATPLVGGY